MGVTSWDHIVASEPDELDALKGELEELGYRDVGVTPHGRRVNVAFRDRSLSRRWSLTFEDLDAARSGLATRLTAEVMDS